MANVVGAKRVHSKINSSAIGAKRFYGGHRSSDSSVCDSKAKVAKATQVLTKLGLTSGN